MLLFLGFLFCPCLPSVWLFIILLAHFKVVKILLPKAVVAVVQAKSMSNHHRKYYLAPLFDASRLYLSNKNCLLIISLLMDLINFMDLFYFFNEFTQNF